MSGRHAAEGVDGVDAGNEPEQSLLRVVGGAPTPEELAAVTAVLAALEAEAAAARATTPRSSAPSGWSSRAARLRAPLASGPGRWRSFSG
ncbi:acyl-CoA carboxylase subunit epsilon [Frigoribacterium sp. ACAM 257]|uniref:acyl-CoA carboxylase epsilon subunit n=1 Tax=Frigoribacterium sp. ACAM 257 TaxID=2508998 RepID=UPI0011B9BEDF|nr:acyl-CoA carboxylase epsilon subunit [Frigoribacterium sp. ACAM 257]TWX40246.1 acyl-CoA carboxylase subunit epsilon [Frigoribacterium sp. ACAM 257]